MHTLAIEELFDKAIFDKASDIHFIASYPPILRIDGRLNFLATYPVLSGQQIENLVFPILTPEQKEMLLNNKTIDFSYGYGGGEYGNKGRFRVNLYYQRKTLAAAFRLFSSKIQTIDELYLPKICHKFTQLKQGFILVAGPTGHGKSTTLAAIINEINETTRGHIITIEDPIEYVYGSGKSIISQREFGIDTHSWTDALRSVVREDPDVLLIGEMRDPESVASAITIAEMGHLVFATIHTNSASQSIDRIIDSFPERQQNQIKIQLAATIEGIVCQKLIPKIDGGRVVATEILLGTSAIKSNIREGKTHLIDSIIETSIDVGMQTMEASLASLVKEGLISVETAKMYSIREKQLLRLIG